MKLLYDINDSINKFIHHGFSSNDTEKFKQRNKTYVGGHSGRPTKGWILGPPPPLAGIICIQIPPFRGHPDISY